jgi:hypothetical protein
MLSSGFRLSGNTRRDLAFHYVTESGAEAGAAVRGLSPESRCCRELLAQGLIEPEDRNAVENSVRRFRLIDPPADTAEHSSSRS